MVALFCGYRCREYLRRAGDVGIAWPAPAGWPLCLGEVESDHAALLRPTAPGTVRLWQVSRAVNNVRNNSTELLDHTADPDATPPAITRQDRKDRTTPPAHVAGFSFAIPSPRLLLWRPPLRQ